MEFISFPKLGIHLNINPIAFQIPLGERVIAVHWYGIIIALAIMVALSLATRQTKKFGIKEEDLLDMFLLALPVSIIFARLFFVVFTWDSFKNDLLGIFRIWEGGLAIYGAIIGAVLSVVLYSYKKKVDMLHLMDFACVYLPLAQAIGRWGNFTNQVLYGSNTDLPWGMTGSIIQRFPSPGVDGARLVHPTFLYESLLNIVVFIILLGLRKKNKVRGSVFAAYLMSYSFIRFLTEFLRTDEFGVGNILYNQVVAALVFVGAFIWLLYLKKRAQSKIEADEVLAPSAYAEVLEEMEKEEEEKEANVATLSDSELEVEDEPMTAEALQENEVGENPEERPQEGANSET